MAMPVWASLKTRRCMPVASAPPQLVRITAGLTVFLGLLVLAGWAFEVPSLKSVLPGAVQMKANTAVCLILSGAALFMAESGRASPGLRRVTLLMALIVAALGFGTLSQYVFGWHLGIDELLFSDRANAYNLIPGRMSPYSAVAFGLIGLALAALRRAKFRLAVALMSFTVLAIEVVSLVGYAWNAAELITDVVLPPVAVHTAFAFTLLGIGTLLAGFEQHAGFGIPAAEATSIELNAAGGFIGAFLLLVVGGLVVYQNGAQYVRSAEMLAHTQEVRARIGQLRAAISNAALSERNYLLTGIARYKVDFAKFAYEAREHALVIDGFVAHGSVQQQRLDQLNGLLTQRLKALEGTTARFDAGGLAAARAHIAAELPVGPMAEIRTLALEMDDAEAALLGVGEIQASDSRRNSLIFLLLTLATAAVFFSVLLRKIRREMLARAKAEVGVRRLNADLELRVDERTAALEENERRFVDLFEFAPEGLLMFDGAGTILQVNFRTEEVFGWTRADLVGQPLEVLMPADARVSHLELIERFLQSNVPRDADAARPALRCLRRDGSIFLVDMSLSRLTVDGEKVVVAAVRDVTEREHMNEALQQSAALYRHTLDHMLEGVQTIGFDWRYRYINVVAEQHIRQLGVALVGRTLVESFPGIESTEVFATLRRCMEERVVQYSENEFPFPDGSRRWFQLNVLPAPEGVSIFSVDITDRKRAESDIRASNVELERRVAERTNELVQAREAAEAANRAKSAFLATMSHEIRTPMNGVVGMVDVLSHSRLSDDQADALRTIRTSAFALLGIIDDVLDFSKIEAGRLDLERAPVALTELIESICDTLLPVAMNKDVELNLFIAPTVPEHVWSDATRLRQILYNLIGNAIKFSAGERGRLGAVSVRAELAPGPTAGLVIRVTDNGIGIAPETLVQIFSSFTQAEASTTRRFGGTGLGLAICERLVLLMQGDINVESTVGEGSTFTVTLPLDVRREGAARPYPKLADLHCIVVGAELEPDDLRTYLEYAGARVERVPDVSAAAQAALGRDLPVVIQYADGLGTSSEGPQATFAATPDIRHLLIVRGRRRRARVAGANVVIFDGNNLRRSALLRAVAVAAGRASSEMLREVPPEEPPFGQLTPPTIGEARAQGRLILIAEDDEVNQKVILRQIELLGYASELAQNGTEALRLWRTGSYGLLLTDLHMPEMDGYTLAETIRREELSRDTELHGRMPILALTANALRGESLRAKAAGMDEYLTKPLQLHLLKAALTKWMPEDRSDTVPPELRREVPNTRSTRPVDVAVLMEIVGDDSEIIDDFLVQYQAAAKVYAAELGAARAVDDIHQIGAIAHKLKSSSRAIGAGDLGDLCSELENACRTGTREGVEQCLLNFETAMLAVDSEINKLVARR
jgi:PAS domain S-box-containing protein